LTERELLDAQLGPNPAAHIFLSGAIDLSFGQDWVPQSLGVWFRPLLLHLGAGYYVNLLRVRKAGVLSRHRHSGPVHAITLRGRWHYLENDWVARAGDYVFEPPGETHTLVVDETDEDAIILFHVTGGYTYLDEEGRSIGVEDVFTKLAATRAHYAASGRSPNDIEQILR
jgi:2,4'-dihydroxyacetophenone dioxygenase